MFCEHEVLNHNNLLCLFCSGSLSCPLEFDTLQRGGGGRKKGGNNVKGRILFPKSKLCPSLLPLCVDVILFSVLRVLAKHRQLTSRPGLSRINTPLRFFWH